MTYSANIKKLQRRYLPNDLIIKTWNSIRPYFSELHERELNSLNDLKKWLKDVSELEAVVSEDACWRQIKMTCDTTDPKLVESFTYFCTHLQPKLQTWGEKLNRKLVDCPFTKTLEKQEAYFVLLRSVKKSLDLFRKKNIPLQSELSVLQQQYGAIAGKMTVTIKDKEYTLQQASKFLENHNRNLRKEVYIKINERRLKDKQQLDKLYTQLIQKRHQEALNAGFENYRDYKFESLGRFDYSKEDCFQFHEAVKLHVLPLVKKIQERKKQKLNLTTLKPWDTDAEPKGTEPLRPFATGKELLEKTVQCFKKLDPFFADCLSKMDSMGHLDLESRKGKAPGGYNCSLAESGAPFIFMNASGQFGDVTTMVHEGGHAIHSFLSHPLPLNSFKDYPMEIAEVASMAMELMSMKHWNIFFENADELKRAKEKQLERVITLFPWIACIDKFQHWVYENPAHSVAQRHKKWQEILKEFSTGMVDTKETEQYAAYSWQRQLHLYEVPFYYIEYGIAQLGAIGMWKQFQKSPKNALSNYTQALSLGGTRTLPHLYEAAGLKLDLSPAHIKTLMEFVNKELEALTK